MAKSKKGFKGLKWSIAVAIVFTLVMASGCSSGSEDSSDSSKSNMYGCEIQVRIIQPNDRLATAYLRE